MPPELPVGPWDGRRPRGDVVPHRELPLGSSRVQGLRSRIDVPRQEGAEHVALRRMPQGHPERAAAGVCAPAGRRRRPGRAPWSGCRTPPPNRRHSQPCASARRRTDQEPGRAPTGRSAALPGAVAQPLDPDVGAMGQDPVDQVAEQTPALRRGTPVRLGQRTWVSRARRERVQAQRPRRCRPARRSRRATRRDAGGRASAGGVAPAATAAPARRRTAPGPPRSR